MNINLSRLTPVNPREVWRYEAVDFTKWLATEENISKMFQEI